MTGLVCRACRRRLKHPTPTGFGPVCAKKRLQGASEARTAAQGTRLASGRSQAATGPPVPMSPGQDQLPLEDP